VHRDISDSSANIVCFCKANRDAWVAFVEAQGLKQTGLDPVRHDEATRRQFWGKHAELAAVPLKPAQLQAPFTLAAVGVRDVHEGRGPCRFGVGCHRPDCYYVHPKDHDKEVATNKAAGPEIKQEFVVTIRATQSHTDENPADEDMTYCKKHRRAWITFVHAEFPNVKLPHDPMLHEEGTRRQFCESHQIIQLVREYCNANKGEAMPAAILKRVYRSKFEEDLPLQPNQTVKDFLICIAELDVFSPALGQTHIVVRVRHSKSRQQVLVQDARYKTALCKNFANGSPCHFGADCMFAHSQHELQPAVAAGDMEEGEVEGHSPHSRDGNTAGSDDHIEAVSMIGVQTTADRAAAAQANAIDIAKDTDSRSERTAVGSAPPPANWARHDGHDRAEAAAVSVHVAVVAPTTVAVAVATKSAAPIKVEPGQLGVVTGSHSITERRSPLAKNQSRRKRKSGSSDSPSGQQRRQPGRKQRVSEQASSAPRAATHAPLFCRRNLKRAVHPMMRCIGYIVQVRWGKQQLLARVMGVNGKQGQVMLHFVNTQGKPLGSPPKDYWAEFSRGAGELTTFPLAQTKGWKADPRHVEDNQATSAAAASASVVALVVNEEPDEVTTPQNFCTQHQDGGAIVNSKWCRRDQPVRGVRAAKRPKVVRPSRSRPVVHIKREDIEDGLIRCPECKTAIKMGGGCSMVTCKSKGHGGRYFYFCFHCRHECPDGNYCSECPGRNDKATRQRVLQCKNKRNRENLIEL
jgi:hypothetical protein